MPSCVIVAGTGIGNGSRASSLPDGFRRIATISVCGLALPLPVACVAGSDAQS